MGIIFRADDALFNNEVRSTGLRWHFDQLFPGVFIPKAMEQTLYRRTVGAFLWANRLAAITGHAAAALHGSRWVDDDVPIELLWENNHPPPGIITRNETVYAGEALEIDGMVVATPARTAYDLGRHLGRDAAVTQLDSLCNATGLTASDMVPLIERGKGRRGIRNLRTAVDLMDGGAQSPKETWLRLLLIDAGYPRPTTQIPVLDEYGYEFAYLDMGWEDVKIAVEYDGHHHGTSAEQWKWDVRRLRKVHDRDWLHIKVIGGDRANDILGRVAAAWAQRRTGK